VFIVRQTPAGDSTVTFGDGTSGARLPSGTGNVIASYRFGAGQASPPAGSVEQIARPADGLRAVRSPLPAVIGADADTPRSMRTSAPQTALVLKRLVSVADYQAIANQRPGVIKAVASFIYLDDQQRAGVRVDYIGTAPAGDLEALFTTLGDPDLPVQVVPALSAPRTLQLTVGIQPRADGSVVSAAVVQTLSDPTTGFLAPANLDIGGQLWVSQLFAAVLGVPNVVEVQSATLIDELGNATSLAAASVVCAPAGTFFDFGGGQGISVATAAPLGGLASPPNSGGTT
jgi:predicted phage baseplate assembly protein